MFFYDMKHRNRIWEPVPLQFNVSISYISQQKKTRSEKQLYLQFATFTV